MAYPIELFFNIITAVILFILPGWCLLSLLADRKPPTFLEKLCLSGGVSICLYPLLLYTCDLLGIKPGSLTVWIPAAFGIVGALVSALRNRKGRRDREILFTTLATFLILALVFVRLWIIRPMLAPAWGDSVQHVFIVQLLLDNGGLFESWAPYAPIRSFSYHFGFHSLAFVWAKISGLSASSAVLVCGQIMNILAILVFYPLVFRLSGNRWAGLASILIAGFLTALPGYYVNWGRYPQLCGHIILLAGLWCFDTYWKGEERRDLRILAVIFLLTLGMGLTHVRVAVIYASAAFVWTLWGILQQKRTITQAIKKILVFGATLLAGVFCLLPWFQRIAENNVYFSRITHAEEFAHLPPVASDISIWTRIDFYYPHIFWILAAIGLLLSLWFRRRMFWPLFLWISASFLCANPQLAGMDRFAGWLNNEVLVFAFYIIPAVAIGWLLGALWRYFSLSRAGNILTTATLLVLLGIGWNVQLRIVDPFFQLITRADLAAFRWIEDNTPEDSRFLVNGSLVQYGSVVGSDAGWWIPFYTRRENTVPPLLYSTERLDPSVSIMDLRQIIIDVEESQGNQRDLREILCREKITHIYLGEKRGRVGYDTEELIPESWLTNNSDFSLIFQKGKAQVWRFEAGLCEDVFPPD